MGQRKSRRRPRFGAALLVLVLLLVAVAGAGAWRLGWVSHWRGTDVPATPPPRPLPIGTYAAAPDALPAADTGRARSALVRRALAKVLPDPALGGHVVVEVAPLHGAPLATVGHGAVMPASTLKLLTTAAALGRLGPGWRGRTTLSLHGHTLSVEDHGDVLLSAADLRRLADRAARVLRRRHVARVLLDVAGAYDGPSTSPHWPASYVPDGVVTPIVSFWVDEGHTPGPDGVLGTEDDGRVPDPTGRALAMLASDLRAAGVRDVTACRANDCPTSATFTGRPVKVAAHAAAPLDQVVAHILQVSDNEGAETLGHLLGDSFRGGVRAVEKELRRLGVSTRGLRLYDASGLSRDDRVPVATLVSVLRLAAHDPRLAGIVDGLPVAGWSGSLADRFDGPAARSARGVATAKTGTLTGVSNLAGFVTTADGTPLIVVAAADRVTETLEARDALDDVLAAIAGCRCGKGG